MTSIPLTILKSGQYIFKVDVEIKSEFFTLLYSLKSTEYFFMNKYCYYETVQLNMQVILKCCKFYSFEKTK